jgi:hypothetical protein
MYLNLKIDTGPEDDNYLSSCARIRHISRTELLRRVVLVSIQDQIVRAILDDGRFDQGEGTGS